MKNFWKSLIYILLLSVIIWWMTYNVVWLGDDLDYKFKMNGEIWQSWGWINSFKEFWESQFTHYRNVNGRFIAHALVQLFNGILGQQIFAVCNAVVYSLFTLSIAKEGKVNPRKNSAGLLSAISLSILCFITKMMPTCQIGYIWAMFFNIIWLSCFFYNKKPSWFSVISLFFTGILVGNWQESISIGICAGLGFWWLSQFLCHHKTDHSFFDWRRSWMMLGYFIGTATNCFAPSTINRVSTISTPLSDQLMIASYSLPAVSLLLVVFIILNIRNRCGLSFSFKFNNGLIPDGFLIVGCIFLLIFNAIIGIYSNRQLFGANLFASILLLRALPRHRFNLFFNAAAVLCVITVWCVMYIGMVNVKRQYEDISALYMESNDGSVECDRTRVLTLGHPLDAKYYEDILGQFNNDLHHSIMKDFKHNKKGKTLKLKPTTIPDAEKVEQYAPGHFYVTVKEPGKMEPKRMITVYGHYTLCNFFNVNASPRELELSVFSRRRSPYATAIIIPEYPFFKADSIKIKPL